MTRKEIRMMFKFLSRKHEEMVCFGKRVSRNNGDHYAAETTTRRHPSEQVQPSSRCTSRAVFFTTRLRGAFRISLLRDCICLLAIGACLSGCGGGGGGSSSGGGGSSPSSGPTISNAAVTPSTLSSGGGTVIIQANVTDSSTVLSVAAVITTPSSATAVLPLAEIGVKYSTTYKVAGNALVGGSAQVYSVVITATDTLGRQSAAAPLSISVPAPAQPPPAP